jgi:phosphatidylserine decarboxylase
VTVGQTVNKGDPLAHFKFGGSDIVCVFSPQAKLSVSDFPAAGQKQWSQYGSLLATAHT